MSRNILFKMELQYPITIPGKDGSADTQITELTFYRIKGKDFKFFPKEADTERPEVILPIIASIALLTEEQAGELDLEDIMEAAEKLSPFYEKFLETKKS